MSPPIYDANLYAGANPTIANADAGRANVGVCFSGGGSRALTCAWGQMIGLRQLPGGNGNSLLDNIRYISSVSGGTWASILYTYLPTNIPDSDFFPELFTPPNLFLDDAPAGGMSVSRMGKHAMGRVPQEFANIFELDPFDNIIAEFITIVVLRDLDLSESLKWLWMFIVGHDVLAPFGLYTYDFSIFNDELPWNYRGAKYFTVSPAYAENHILNKQQHPALSNFVFVNSHAGRAMLIANTNIVGQACPNADMMGPMQIPVQVTPVSAGSLGANPCAPDDAVGGGSVESFAFTSELQSQGSPEEITASFPRAYSLVDITSTSSAFFAAKLVDNLQGVIEDMLDAKPKSLSGRLSRLLHRADDLFHPERRKRLMAMRDECDRIKLSDVVPVYNTWPVALAGDGPAANSATQFTDGGDLENTGILGMLAQTDVDTIIAFVNTSVKLEQVEDVIIAVAQAAPLFGIAFDDSPNEFKAYEADGVNPFSGEVDPKGFLQVFDNSNDEFNALREALYKANGSGTQRGPAFHQQSLTVVENKLAGVAARTKPVTVLWVQNARVNDWQSQIKDVALSEAVSMGQEVGGLSEFADFPYYSTFTKVYQTAAETNTLAQMWAWCVGDAQSPLSAAIKDLF